MFYAIKKTIFLDFTFELIHSWHFLNMSALLLQY